jgi:predicted permease
MKQNIKSEQPEAPARAASPVALFSEWVQQGTENYFAAQRILLDLVMRQNAMAMNTLRERFAGERPVAAVSEFAGEGVSNFIAAQKILLNLADRQNEIVMKGLKERVGPTSPAAAMTDLLRRGVENYIHLQKHFLNVADKTESVLLSMAGGVVGLVIGALGVRALLAVNPGNIPRIGPNGSAVSLDWAVMGFTLLLSLATGILFGLVPAMQASRADLNITLKETGARGGSGMRQNKMRGALVMVEMALAMVLLIGAGLLIRTFSALHTVAPGFDAHHVLTMDTALTGSRYDRTAAIETMTRQALDRIHAIPGVEAAAATSYLPLEGGLGLGFVIEGRPLTNGTAHGGAGWNYVTARFFDVFKIPIVRGRAFTERDDAAGQPVVVINQAFARKYWKDGDPIGHRLIIGGGMGPDFEQPPREIIGIAGDARDGGLNNDPQPETFVPLAQVGDAYMALNNRFMPLSWVVRTKVAPFSVSAPIQSAFQDAADLPAAHIRSMEQIVVGSTARDQFNTWVLGIFATVAILLASIGLYGLMAYAVEQRTLEFGIRLALGADFPALRNMIVRQAMMLAAAGIVVGLAAAYGLTRFLASVLYGVKPTDPVVFGSVTVLFAGVALLASYLPARRALRVDPVVALRVQ